MESVYGRFAGLASVLVPWDRIVISTLHEDGRSHQIAYVTGTSVPGWEKGTVHPLAGTVLGQVITARHNILVPDMRAVSFASRFPANTGGISAGLISGIGVPLVFQGAAVGALGFLSQEVGFYAEKHLKAAERIAAQISGAVAMTQTAQHLEREAGEREALAEIGRIASSSIEIEEVFERIAGQARKLLQFDRIVVALLDSDTSLVVDAHISGYVSAGAEQGRRHPLLRTSTYAVLQKGGPIMLEEEALRASDRHGAHEWALPAGLRSFMAVPMVWREQAVGSLNFRSRRPEGFNAHEVALAEQIAAQIAGAVVASRLYGQARQDALERTTVAEIGRLVSSTLNIEDVYPRFVELVHKLVPFDRVVIAEFDHQAGVSIDAYVAGVHLPGYEQGGRHSIKGTAFEPLIEARRSIALTQEHLRAEEIRAGSFGPALRVGLNSMLITPLVWQDRVVGSLNFRSREPHPYGPREVALAEQVGAQIAGAITTAKLYREARREADTRQALAAISVAASRGLEMETAFDAVADELTHLIGFKRMSITLINPDTNELEVAYVRGTPIPGKTVGARVVAPAGEQWEWRTALESDNSARADSEVLTGLGLQSRMEVPLGVPASGLIGYLGLWSDRTGAYSESDLDLLGRVAAQITPAVQNVLVHRRTLQLVEAREHTTQLEAQARELERVNEAKSQFLSTVSHELRTPLTSVMAFTDLIARDRQQMLNEKQRHQLEIVRRNARQLSALINDLLDLSKIESGRLELMRREFSVTDLLKEVADSFSPVLAAKNQRLELKIAQDEVFLMGDRERIMLIVSNLVSNASKYSPERTSVRLSAGLRGDYVAISVRDEGIGISKADQVHLFTPFFRVDNSLTRAVSGTGLGLVIVRRLVEMHGGTVTVESEPGAGAEFTVLLPRVMQRGDDA
jgi:signal transduction histidine kinase/putative methionine-R-sulfoxide reductase with GAF domain